MTFSKALTKKTPLSKITAAIILIGLVLIGFAFGVIYAQTIDFAKNQTPATIIIRKIAPSITQVPTEKSAKKVNIPSR